MGRTDTPPTLYETQGLKLEHSESLCKNQNISFISVDRTDTIKHVLGSTLVEGGKWVVPGPL